MKKELIMGVVIGVIIGILIMILSSGIPVKLGDVAINQYLYNYFEGQSQMIDIKLSNSDVPIISENDCVAEFLKNRPEYKDKYGSDFWCRLDTVRFYIGTPASGLCQCWYK